MTSPTLVISRSPDEWMVPREFLSRAAHEIPGAVLADLGDGDAMIFGLGLDDVLVEISRFLTGDVHLPAPERHLAAVLFTDLVDSTRQLAQHGDANWKRLMDRHDSMCREEVARGGGDVVKMTGDGVLALFPSVTGAVRCAQRLRDRLADESLEIRTGVHVGEVDRRGEDVSGLAVNVAARVMSRASGGEVLATRTAMSVTDEVVFEGTGVVELKGIDGEWELFRAR